MIVRTNDWLAYKERLMLAYVSERFPKPFYICWRDEANAVVRQVVGMRRRQRLIEQRRRGEAAAKASSAPAAKR